MRNSIKQLKALDAVLTNITEQLDDDSKLQTIILPRAQAETIVNFILSFIRSRKK